MNQSLKLVLLILFLMLSLQSKAQKIRYFDSDNNKISKEKYFRKLNNYESYFDILKNDSTKILVLRENQGKLKKIKQLLLTVKANIYQPLDVSKNTLIYYYPGKDLCNSTGSATKKSYKKWYSKLEKKIKRKDSLNIIKIYKDNYGLNAKNNVNEWDLDPFQIIEKSFFKYHYSCGSFVIVGPNGNYVSFFGEYGHNQVIEALKKLKEAQRNY